MHLGEGDGEEIEDPLTGGWNRCPDSDKAIAVVGELAVPADGVQARAGMGLDHGFGDGLGSGVCSQGLDHGDGVSNISLDETSLRGDEDHKA